MERWTSRIRWTELPLQGHLHQPLLRHVNLQLQHNRLQPGFQQLLPQIRPLNPLTGGFISFHEPEAPVWLASPVGDCEGADLYINGTYYTVDMK